jgi:hypothetical protein
VGRARSQLFGPDSRRWVTADAIETIALLQHLGWPTPYLDLTDDVEVAFFFACDRYARGRGS